MTDRIDHEIHTVEPRGELRRRPKVGRSIKFDPDTEKVVGDKKADELAIPEYRAPWKFPSEYL